MPQTNSDQTATPAVFLAASQPLFSLGQVVATPAALELLAEHAVEPVALLSRHVSGDWGQLSSDDACANDDAVRHGDRVLSSYVLPLTPEREPVESGARVWVITEADRSCTTLLMPSEY